MADQAERTVVDFAALQRVHRFMAGLRERAAVCPVSARRRDDAWLVTRYPDVRALLADDRVRRDMVDLGLTDGTLTPHAHERLRPLLTARITELLDGFDPDGPIDIVTQFGIPLTTFALRAGQDTTVNLITNTTLSLLTAPEELTLLRTDPELVTNTIEEVLRYECPVNILPPRYAAEPITVDGATIPAGGLVLLSVASANRDGAEFPDPDRFDITRPPGRQLAFGHGIHYCPGARLARLVARLAIGALIARFPKLRLVSNPAQLRWRDSTLMHGPEELLIRVD